MFRSFLRHRDPSADMATRKKSGWPACGLLRCFKSALHVPGQRVARTPATNCNTANTMCTAVDT